MKGNAQTPIILNGTWLKVVAIRFDEADLTEDEYYHDAYITFASGEIERFDACDVKVLKEGEYTEKDFVLQ